MYVIVGPPGAGKSTLALLLASRGYKTVEAMKLALREEAYLAYDVERDALIVDPELCTEEILVAPFLPECEPLYCIYVDVPKEILRERLSRRGYKKEKLEENLEASEILRIEAEETCDEIIFVDGRDVEAYVEDVIRFLETFSNRY